MQVAKWGNSLAVRLPAAVVEALQLKEGDEVEIHVADAREFAVTRKPGREELLRRLHGVPRASAGRLQVRPGRGKCQVVSSTPTCCCILCSRHNPKNLWIDDTKIVGDRIAEVRPVSRDFFS